MKKLLLLLLCASAFAQTIFTRMLSGVNYQSGATYTFATQDVSRITAFNSSSAVTATLPAGNALGFVNAAAIFSTVNIGTGTTTIICSSCTINGAGTLVLTTGQSAVIYGDGINYVAALGGSGGGPATPPTLNAVLNPTGSTALTTGTFRTTFTAGDFGISPVGGTFNITDTSTSATDNSYDLTVTVPPGSYHNAFLVSGAGFNQFQVCANGAGHSGIIVVGSTLNCNSGVNITTYSSKMWVTAASHTATSTFFDGHTSGYTGSVVRAVTAMPTGTAYNFLTTCASGSTTDGSCTTPITSIRGDGLFTTPTVNFVNSLTGGTSIPTACNGTNSCIALNNSSGSVTPTAGQNTIRFSGGNLLCSINGGAEAVCSGGGSGTVSANSGSAGAIGYYAAAAGSTTIGPNTRFTDNGSTLAYTGTSGISAPIFTANGSGAGQLACTQGGAQSAPANGIGINCPTTVGTGYVITLPTALPSIPSTLSMNASGTVSYITQPTLTTAIPSADTLSAAGTFATTLTLSANGNQVGSLIAIRAHGVFTTTGTASPLATFQVNAGGTSGACNAPSSITLPTSVTNGAWNLICYIQINTTGAPGTAIAWGSYEIANNANGATAASNNRLFPNTGTFSYTTNSGQTVSIQETSTLVTGQTFTLQAITANVTY